MQCHMGTPIRSKQKNLENLQIKYTRCYHSVFTCKTLNTFSFYCASLKCLQLIVIYMYLTNDPFQKPLKMTSAFMVCTIITDSLLDNLERRHIR